MSFFVFLSCLSVWTFAIVSVAIVTTAIVATIVVTATIVANTALLLQDLPPPAEAAATAI